MITLYEVMLAFMNIDRKLKEMEQISNTDVLLDQIFSNDNIDREKEVRSALFLNSLPKFISEIESLKVDVNKAYVNNLHNDDLDLKNSLRELYTSLDNVLHNLNKYNNQ